MDITNVKEPGYRDPMALGDSSWIATVRPRQRTAGRQAQSTAPAVRTRVLEACHVRAMGSSTRCMIRIEGTRPLLVDVQAREGREGNLELEMECVSSRLPA